MWLCMKPCEPAFALFMNSEVVKIALLQFVYKCILLFPFECTKFSFSLSCWLATYELNKKEKEKEYDFFF